MNLQVYLLTSRCSISSRRTQNMIYVYLPAININGSPVSLGAIQNRTERKGVIIRGTCWTSVCVVPYIMYTRPAKPSFWNQSHTHPKIGALWPDDIRCTCTYRASNTLYLREMIINVGIILRFSAKFIFSMDNLGGLGVDHLANQCSWLNACSIKDVRQHLIMKRQRRVLFAYRERSSPTRP